jgi:hypothetical protein
MELWASGYEADNQNSVKWIILVVF